MALIKCPECGKEISNTVTNCPQCGYSIQEQSNQQLLSSLPQKKKKKPIYKKVWFWIVLIVIVIPVAMSLGDNDSKTNDTDTGNTSSDEQASSPANTPNAATESPAPVEGEGVIGKYYVKIKDIEMAKDYNDNNAVIVTYEWTNNSDKSKAFLYALEANVFQDGIECKTPIMKIDGVGSDGLTTEIQPGKTYEFKVGYTLDNSTPEIEVEIKELISFSKNPPIVSKKFELEL